MTTSVYQNTREVGSESSSRPCVFSGHESFACRYGWLPKLYAAVLNDPHLFESDEQAILQLGLGRNMVKSLRFWGEVFGITNRQGREVHPTKFAHMLLSNKNGFDPYLEKSDSLWRLHWTLTVYGGLGAWVLTFLDMLDSEITRDRFVAAVRAFAARFGRAITPGTASTHVNVFLQTYAGSEATEVSIEEALGSPLQELELARLVTRGGVSTIRFLRGPKRTLSVSAFAFVLHDFWQKTARESATLSVRSLLLARSSPGAVLMLDESGLHEKLEDLCVYSNRLQLRSDGLGGFDLTSRGEPLQQLRKVAWS